jgi:tetratricopeptide (TPR) repeat protein
VDDHHDIYQKPAAPAPPPAPLPSYDLTPEQVRTKTRRQTMLLGGVLLLILVLAAVHFITSESHWAKTEQLREALNRPLFPRVARTNQPAVSLQAQLAPLPDDPAATGQEPPAGVSPQRMAEAMGHVRIGNEYLRAGDLDRAEEEARAALGIWPNMNAALRMLGMLYIQRGQFDQAIAALDRAMRSDPFNAETYNNAAAAFMQKRQFGRAEELLANCLQIRPGYAIAEFNLGLLYILWGRYDDALGFLQEALQKMPGNPALMNNIAVCHIRLGRQGEARVLLLQLVEASPSTPVAYFNLAITHALDENVEETLRWLRLGAERCSPAECQTYLGDADFDRVRNRPEFQELLRTLMPGLPVAPPGPTS